MTSLRRMYLKPLPGEKAVRSLILVSAGIAVACGLPFPSVADAKQRAEIIDYMKIIK